VEGILFWTTIASLGLAIIYMVKSSGLSNRLGWSEKSDAYACESRDTNWDLYCKERDENFKLRAVIDHKKDVIKLRNEEIQKLKCVIEELAPKNCA